MAWRMRKDAARQTLEEEASLWLLLVLPLLCIAVGFIFVKSVVEVAWKRLSA